MLTFLAELMTMCPMDASSHRLAAAIAERLTELLPAPLTAIAIGHTVAIVSGRETVGSSPAAAILDDDDGRSKAEKAHAACSAVLNGLQDDLMVHLARPWPTDDDGELGFPTFRTEAHSLRAWFGDDTEERAIVRLRPFDLDQL